MTTCITIQSQAVRITRPFYELNGVYAALGSVLIGDFVFLAGQITGEVVTSFAGAAIVALSTLANVYLSFKRKHSEHAIERKERFLEMMRKQREKDLVLEGKIRETTELMTEIGNLKAENRSLRDKLKELIDGKNSTSSAR